MSTTPTFNDLHADKAVQKVRELVKHEMTCLMITNLKQAPLSIRPMATIKIDDAGNIYFFSRRDSTKNRHIGASPEIQLTYSNDSNSEYLILYGKAEAYRDQEEIDQLWVPIAKAWFPDGKEDANITIIRFRPESGYYYDTKHGKLVQLIGMLYGAVTGSETDDSIEGNIKL